MQTSNDLAHQTMLFTFTGSLVTLVVCMMFGVFGRLARIFTNESDRILSNVLIKITLPATVFMSMLRPFSSHLLLESAITVAAITMVFLFGLAFGVLMSKIMPGRVEEKRIWQFALIFPNVTYMGFPVIHAVFGDEGMFYASIVTMVFNLVGFSLGVYIVKGGKGGGAEGFNLKQVILAPAFIAVFIGFIFFVTQLRFPFPIERGIGLVGNMTTPIAMILIGSLLTKVIRNSGIIPLATDWRVYPIVFVRLVVIPLTTFLILRHFIDNPVMLGTIVTLAAMPAATITAIFAEQYGGDTETALKTVALSDIFCLLTIPLLALLLR